MPFNEIYATANPDTNQNMTAAADAPMISTATGAQPGYVQQSANTAPSPTTTAAPKVVIPKKYKPVSQMGTQQASPTTTPQTQPEVVDPNQAFQQIMQGAPVNGNEFMMQEVNNRKRTLDLISSRDPEEIANILENGGLKQTDQVVMDLKNYYPEFFQQVIQHGKNYKNLKYINNMQKSVFDKLEHKTSEPTTATADTGIDQHPLFDFIKENYGSTAADYYKLSDTFLNGNPELQKYSQNYMDARGKRMQIQTDITNIEQDIKDKLGSEVPDSFMQAYVARQTRDLNRDLQSAIDIENLEKDTYTLQLQNNKTMLDSAMKGIEAQNAAGSDRKYNDKTGLYEKTNKQGALEFQESPVSQGSGALVDRISNPAALEWPSTPSIQQFIQSQGGSKYTNPYNNISYVQFPDMATGVQAITGYIDNYGLQYKGKDRWTYLGQMGLTQNKWDNSTPEQKKNYVMQMYQHEGGGKQVNIDDIIRFNDDVTRRKMSPEEIRFIGEQKKKIMDDPHASIDKILEYSNGGKNIGADQSKTLIKFDQAMSQLGAVEKQIKDMNTGPIIGRLKSLNPYDTNAQILKAQLQGLVPVIARGVYGEVGVLTDNDIKLYSQTLPSLKSTEAVNKGVMAMTLDVLAGGYKRQLQSLAGQGYDVAGLRGLYENIKGQANALRTDIGIPTSAEETQQTPPPTQQQTNPAFNPIASRSSYLQ